MALILGKAWQGYLILFDEIVDPRTKSWPLVAKPYQPLALLAVYLMFVRKWGPQFMKNRQPFNLDKILIVYNAIQVVACLHLFVNSIRLAWGWDYKWLCEPIDYSNSPKAIEIAETVYLYYMLKIIDLLDTVFFVLRKKHNQVSFLHLYHHTGMVALVWGAVTYLPGGHGTLVGVINAFVHIVMYTYYLLTVAYPSVKNAIWFKKHVTQLQILQFFWCVMHMALIVFKTDCEYPRWTAAIFLPQNLFMLILFIDFYIKAYIRKPKEKLDKNQTVSNNGTDNKENGNNVGKRQSNGNGINKLSDTNGNNAKAKTNTKNDVDSNIKEFDVNSNICKGGNKKSCGNCKSKVA